MSAEPEKERIRAQREARIRTIEDILTSEARIRYAYVPELDCRIAFKKPTIADLKNITDISDPFERAKQYVYLLWSKADPGVTMEKIEQLPGDVVLAIARAFDEASAPLPRRQSTTSSGPEEGKTSTS
jgi:hypothetical protein